ncbi:hypothetical protein OG373_40850 [Streptomyces avidinii]|uniref:hypothetical protein n=1 Tax=Streptomyces avidinii TaxID=1895 RepID=UPI003864B9D0|nr:hypothetical protein OG373_00320 [Streptomyces avidinii]WTB02210.1 hypothetical protein OG373_40850 [Streptomyces avidinii]
MTRREPAGSYGHLGCVAALLLTGGLLLSLTVAESWFWLALTGFALMTAVHAVKDVRRLRTRRSAAS